MGKVQFYEFKYKAKLFLINNYKKLIACIVAVIIFFVGVAITCVEIRKPNLAEGNLFDKNVMKLFWCEWLERPEGVQDEVFTVTDSDYGGGTRTYRYTCYTAEYEGERYIESIKGEFIRLNGNSFITGFINEGDLFYSNYMDDSSNGSLSQDDGKLLYEVVYTKYLNRKLEWWVMPYIELYAMYPRYLTVTASEENEESKGCKITLEMRVSKNEKLLYSGEKKLKFIRVF